MKGKYLLFLLFIPFIINASVTYDDGVKYANSYTESFDGIEKYLLLKGENNEFTYGGFLSKNEYDVSNSQNSSYLSPGIQYWTLTNTNDGKKYIIDYDVKSLETEKKSGIRVTEYVKENVTASGTGTFSSPWTFAEQYRVNASSTNKKYGKIITSSVLVSPGGTAEIKYSTVLGYKYNNANCNDTVVSNDSVNNKIIIREVSKDINCSLVFVPRTDIRYRVQYYTENANDANYSLITTTNEAGTTESQVNANLIKVSSSSDPKISELGDSTKYTINSAKSTLSGIVLADGSLVLKIYLNRVKYRITLANGAGIGSITINGSAYNPSAVYNYKYGAQINLVANVSGGYTWQAWTSNPVSLVANQVNNNSKTINMPNQGVSMTATATVTPPPPPAPPAPAYVPAPQWGYTDSSGNYHYAASYDAIPPAAPKQFYYGGSTYYRK